MLFAKPLLLKDSMEREIQAVESEFKGCYNDDNCRLWELMGRYSEGNDKRHLLNRFTIILQPFQQRLSLSINKHIIYVYQESYRTASNLDLASSSSSKLRHVCRHHHHSVLITSQAREK